MFIKIKGIQEEIIEENGILVYKNHFCECPCHKRITVKKSWHKKAGIPRFIYAHNLIMNPPFKSKHHKPESIEKMKEARKKQVSPNKSKPNPETINKISKTLKKYYAEHPEERERRGNAHSKYLKEHPECVDIIRKSHKGKHLSKQHIESIRKALIRRYSDPNEVEKQIIRMKEYCKIHPLHMKIARKGHKSISKSELKIRSELDKLNITYITNVHEIIGTPDIVIPYKNIIIFVDGCYWHGCDECFSLNKFNNKMQEKQQKTKYYDEEINKKLSEQGFRIIRIWEHDIKNEKYKEILDNLKDKL